ncbi:uncharacterized protein LOC114535065 [Dendronephthya gigantea]|uniref:uncharacterized protein LOC114535065 n=1 Tax=Dendronephthya gigantea TaxID=151771 RepID=UPI00106BDCEF|nr:uncharacterized protein LOC114535065 [Dendronephthya gigantea]
MKPIASLKWSNKQQPFSEVLEKYEVPNLVRVHEGHYSMNDACCFESDQLLMLHATRTKKSFLAKNSVGRRIAIPERCKSKLLVCPLSTYYGSDPIFASEMSNIYPDVKYFRVLENTSIVDKEVKRFFEPESILEVAFIDSVNSQVKFKDVEQPLSFSCRIVFEALLDYREYTLQKAARVFRLPIKVRFLPQSDEGQSADMNNDFEIMASNLGMVTICDLSKPELVVVVTELDATDLCSTLARSTVKCLQISKDCKLNVSVAKGLIKNDSDYLNMLHDFNKAFLYKYDMKGLNDFDKCYYLNDGHTIPEITASVLTSKICQSRRPGRRKSDSTVESPLGCHDYESIAYVEAPCDDDGYELVDHVNITRQSYANMEALDDAFVMSHDYMDIDDITDMASW